MEPWSTFIQFQKQRIKIAFAEGYLAGNTNADGTQKGGKAMKYLKVSSHLSTKINVPRLNLIDSLVGLPAIADHCRLLGNPVESVFVHKWFDV